MIPDLNSPLIYEAKYSILEEGDIMLEGDEFYNPLKDMWLPVQTGFIGDEFYLSESKPVRRKNKNYKP